MPCQPRTPAWLAKVFNLDLICALDVHQFATPNGNTKMRFKPPLPKNQHLKGMDFSVTLVPRTLSPRLAKQFGHLCLLVRTGISADIRWQFDPQLITVNYERQLSDENAEIAEWLLKLTSNRRTWGFGLCFLYLRNVKGFGWNCYPAGHVYMPERAQKGLPDLLRTGAELAPSHGLKRDLYTYVTH